MIRMCQKTGCTEPATCAFKVCVPAYGKSPRDFAPLEALVGVTLCNRHMNETNPSEWLNANNGAMKTTMTSMANGRARPDFPRAYLKQVSINSPEFQRFEQMTAAAGPE